MHVRYVLEGTFLAVYDVHWQAHLRMSMALDSCFRRNDDSAERRQKELIRVRPESKRIKK